MIRHAILIAGIALLLAGVARADDGDSSPDKNFYGFWRVIEATRGPWIRDRPLKAGGAPLLGWMIEFADDQLKGPPGLGCKPARYVGGQASLPDMFDKRLDRDNYVEEGSVLGFMVGAESERIVCGNGTHLDYYMTHRGDPLIAVGDVIYRLRRPDGDPSTWQAGYAGPGFDCVTAVTASQLTICGDLRLSALDRTMTQGYKRLEASETADSFDTVRAAQAAWVAAVVRRCQAGGPLPDHSDDVAVIRDCLAEDYTGRAALFDGARVAKADGFAIEPRMRFEASEKPLFFDSDCYPWLTGAGPAPAAFNAAVAETLRQDTQRVDHAGLRVPKNFPPGLAFTARRRYVVARFDGHIISLQMRTQDFTGGSHEQFNEFSIDWDLVTGAPIGFADLFPVDKDGVQFTTDLAMKDLAAQFGVEPPPRQDDVARIVADPNNWLFGADAVTVHFPTYSIADFSKGSFDVAIPYAALKAYLMPNAPVRAGR